MAGGKGERFWPQSRQSKPKQFLSIVGDKPLLAQTVLRMGDMVPPGNIIVLTGAEYVNDVAEACPMLDRANIIGEPVGRDTAAAVGLATILVRQRDPDASFAVLPSDHVIKNDEGFRSVLEQAFVVAETEDALVTIGIEPLFPSTGYGYIQRGGETMRLLGLPVFDVKRFVEKPSLDVARQYVNSGEYFWNAGMFIWRVSTVATALEKHVPDLWAGLTQIGDDLASGADIDGVLAEKYPTLRKISIDYALMEKADNVLTLPGIFDWDDVGAWPALVRHLPADSKGNIIRGNAIVFEGSDNIVIGSNEHLVTVMGLNNCIVVHTEDATMVCPRDRAQDIKNLVREVSLNPRWKDMI